MTNPYVIRNGYLFWRPQGHGYTSQVLEAGLWSEAEARRIAKNRPGEDEAVALADYLQRLEVNPTIVYAVAEKWK